MSIFFNDVDYVVYEVKAGKVISTKWSSDFYLTDPEFFSRRKRVSMMYRVQDHDTGQRYKGYLMWSGDKICFFPDFILN